MKQSNCDSLDLHAVPGILIHLLKSFDICVECMFCGFKESKRDW